ncbi:serine/arginine repetitive matrix protein 1-like [Balaenoptera acutorostrata]|uniref:Serine/arginine repetitive matrix protein 1-like n=1 Tax=Balaenoptera acutorostrata TaxID=9767 RepID=A0ABM3TZ37_BALAC|nr:serine/arginine repetitive matrix protein 1-like [Balaenoptera acutorostrata]
MVRRWRRGRPPRGEPSRAQGRAPGSRRAAPPRPRPRPRPPGPPPARREGRRRLTGGGGRPGRGGSRAAGKGRRGPRVPERCAGLGGGRRVTGARASRGASASAAFSPSSPRRGPAAPARVKRKRRQRRLGRRAGKVAKGPVDATWPRRKRRRPGPRSGACRGLARRCGGAPRSHLSASPSRRGRAAGGGDGRVVLAAGRRAGGGAERARCRERRGARARSEAARSPGPRALQSSLRVTRQSCLQAPRAPHPPAGGRAGRPLRAPPGPLLRPPPRRPPPSARVRWPAGRGAPDEVGEAAAGPSSPRCLLAARRRRCGLERLKVSPRPRRGRPRWLSRRHTPQGRERAGGWRPRPRARPAATECGPAKEEFFALLSSFTLLVFSPKGEKKPHNLRMCARVEIDVGRKKKGGGGGSLALAVREETVRASPLRFLGAGGGGRGRGRRNLFRSVLPAPPAHPRFPPLPSSAFARRRGEPALAPPPYPPRGRATSAVSKLSHHVGAPDPRPAGRLAAPTGSQPRVPALASSAAAQALPPARPPPSAPGRGTSRRRSRPGPAWGALSGAAARRGESASGAAGCLRQWMSLPGCSARAERPGLPAHWARRGPRGLEGPGRPLPLPAARPEKLLDCGGHRPRLQQASELRAWQAGEVSSTTAATTPQLANPGLRQTGSQSRLSHGQLCRSDPQGSPQPPRSLIASFSGQPAAVALSPDRSLAEARKSGGRAPPPSRSEEPTRSL